MPILTTLMTNVATRLTVYENHATDEAHEVALTQKIFILNFITSYLPILLTAFVYVPFGQLVVPYLDVFKLSVEPLVGDDKQGQLTRPGFRINPDRLRKQIIFFTVTAQVINLLLEVIVPYLKREVFVKYREMQSKRTQSANGGKSDEEIEDVPEEVEFLNRVRAEAQLDVYDVTTDLREMVLQVSCDIPSNRDSTDSCSSLAISLFSVSSGR